jgi:hypothetical protein
VNYDDPEGIAPTVKRIQYQYVNALGQTRFGSADMLLSAGQAGRGTCRFSANIAGVRFKFYTEWRDNAGGFDTRYPTAGLVE